MTVQSWDKSLIGVDPARHCRAVLVVPGVGVMVDTQALDELRRWGWTVTVADLDTEPGRLEELARHHDVALFSDIRGTRAARRALTRLLPTVAVVPTRGRGRLAALVAEAGTQRDTTVLVVRDPRDAKILRKLSSSALVRSEAADDVRDRATALAAVLLRAHAWQIGPIRTQGAWSDVPA
jgi:hypothetical protein